MSYMNNFSEAITLVRNGLGIKNDKGELIAIVRDDATAKLLIQAAGVADVGPYEAKPGKEALIEAEPKFAELLNKIEEALTVLNAVSKDLEKDHFRAIDASAIIRQALDNF